MSTANPPSPALLADLRARLLRILTSRLGRVLARGVLLLAAMLYFGFAILIIALRYSVLPDIESHRADIEQAATHGLGRRVTIERVEADWRGLRPYLALRKVTVFDEDNRPALELGLVESSIAWSSLWHFEFRQDSLQLWRPSVTVRRDRGGQVFIAGIPLSKSDTSDGRAANWLLAQNEISVRDADITWIDEQRAAPPLALAHVEFLLENSGGRHRFALRAAPPREHASILELRGDLHGDTAADLAQLRGSLFADLEYADLAAWRAWVDYPIDLRQGRGGLRLWAEFKARELRGLVADVGLADVVTRLSTERPVLELRQLQGRFQFKYAETGYTVAGTGVTMRTQSGLAIEPADFSVRMSRLPAKEGGEIRANGVNLQKLAQIAEFLPLDPALQKSLEDYAPQGNLFGMDLTWDGALGKPDKYALQAKFTGLGARAGEGLSGFSGMSGSVRADEKGGSLTLDSHAASIELPAVFSEALVPFDVLNAAVRWRLPASGLEVDINSLAFANADAAGSASGNYRAASGGPGYADLDARLTRADARQVARYLPLRIKEPARNWVSRAALAGISQDVRFKLKGDLAHFPFADDKDGTFSVIAQVRGGKLEYAEAWPVVDNIAAELVFHGRRLEVNATQATILGARVGHTRVEIPDLLDKEGRIININGSAEGPTSEFLRFIEVSPVANMIDDFTRDMRAVGNGRLQLKMSVPLPVAKPKISGSFQFLGNQLMPEPTVPPFSQLNGRLEFTESGVSARNLGASFLGGPAIFNIATRADTGITVAGHGTANMQNLQRALDYPWAKKLAGSTPWRVSIAVKRRAADIVFDSSLAGIASDLPEPMRKSVAEAAPLHVERHVGPSEPARDGTPVRQETWQVTLGKTISAHWIARSSSNGSEIQRGNFAINEVAQLPPRGVVLSGHLNVFDVDQWRELAIVPADGRGMDGMQMNLRLGALDALGRRLNDVDVRSTLQEGNWHSSVKSREMEGDLDWQPGGKGKVKARLKQFTLPEASPYAKARALQEAAAPGSAPPSTAPRDARRERELPELDLIAENFVVREKVLGRLELSAVNAGRDWNIDKLVLSNADGSMRGGGVWQNYSAQPRTSLNIHLESGNIGRLLERLGYPGTMLRGEATLDGKLSWAGSPQSIDYPSLGGNLKLDAKKGQFSKIEPGIGKLLGILSLQALPRRITLDFRDIFSDGFAFEQIAGSVDIARGVMTTRDLKIDGPSANVQISGSTSLVTETQNLRIRVLPTVGEGVSLLSAFLINPVVGITSLVAQKLFKDPLSQILAYEYGVTGSWDDPKVEKLRGPQAQPADAAPNAVPLPVPGAATPAPVSPFPPVPQGAKQ